MLNLATRYQHIASLATKAQYGTDDLFDGISALRLATAVADRNATFANDVWTVGHTLKFRQDSAEDGGVADYDSEEADVEYDGAEVQYEQAHSVRLIESGPELDDLLVGDSTMPTPKPTGIIPWLVEVYNSSRGFGLGTFDASLLPQIWKRQSANWKKLALGYVRDVVCLVHNFTLALVSAICEDQRVQSALMSILMDGLIERYKKSIAQTKFVLRVEKLGTPFTANHYFADNLEK